MNYDLNITVFAFMNPQNTEGDKKRGKCRKITWLKVGLLKKNTHFLIFFSRNEQLKDS